MFRFSSFPVRLVLLLAALLWTHAADARAETLTLAQCLRETADHNPAIIAQYAAVERTFAERLTLRARALPILTVGGILGQLEQETVGMRTTVIDQTTQKKTTKITPTVDETQFVALGTETLYQPLFDAAIPAAFRRGTAGILAAQENVYTVASSQLHLARTLFLQALFQQKNGALLHDADRVLAANTWSLNQLVSAGLVGRANLLFSQVQRANFDPTILSTTGTYRTTLARLLQTMGRELNVHGQDALAGITLAGSLGENLPAFDAADAAHRALDRRPDIVYLRRLIRVYGEDVNIARAGYYPLIRLYVNGEAVPQTNVRNNTPNAVRATDQVSTTEIRPGIQEDWTIIDTGTVRGAVRSREAARDLLSISLARLERNVPSDLAVVRARLDDARGTIAALSGNVDTAQNTLNIIQAGVAQGINSQLEFLDAQGGVLSIRGSLLAANLELSLARAEFDRITGNYLQFVNARPPADSTAPTAKK